MSVSKPWKALERRAAKLLGGIRLWRPDFSDSIPDGESERECWDAKYRQAFTLVAWFVDAERKYRGYAKGRRFLLFLHDSRYRGDFVLVRAEEYARLLECERQSLSRK